MARSVHTDPIDIRAARRLATPHAARGINDRHRLHRLARQAKRRGVQAGHSKPALARNASRLRIIRHAPSAGYAHPAEPADIRRLLQRLPPRYQYKLHTIELRPSPAREAPGALPLGRLLLPGRVILFAQPCSPWMLGGLLADAEQERLMRAGASVYADRRSCLTVVTWPEGRLRDFMLYDVLLHELAHHALQVRHARPCAAAARRIDHEYCADRLRDRLATRLTRHAEEEA